MERTRAARPRVGRSCVERIARGLPALRCALALGFVLATSPALAQDQCIEPSLESNVMQCDPTWVAPGARTHARARAVRQVDRPSATLRPPEPELEPPSPLGPAQDRREARQRDLLEREVRVLERLRDRSRDPARLGDVLHRLAQTLSELVTADETRARQLDEPIFVARRSGNAPELQRLTREQSAATASSRAFRQQIVDSLAALVRAQPNRADLDASLFTLAYHVERLGRHEQARAVYRRMIRDFPNSPFVPHAYLAFGDYYFGEGDLAAARQFYERVLEIPPSRNTVYGYARYKLAWTLYNLDDFSGSLDAFVATLEYAQQNPDRPDSTSLANQVRRELVLPYSRVGRPSRALAFFRRVAADEDGALSMLRALATLYHDSGHWPESIQTHHQLMAARPDAEALCEWQGRVLDATIASRPKPEQVREAERLVAIHRRQREQRPGSVSSCSQSTAASLILLATAWHREAVGTDESPGTHDEATMDAAADLYGLITRELPNLDELELPAIDPRDRPTLATISFYNGELLFERERWGECAQAFEQVLDRATDPQLAADAAYVTVLCYDRHLGSRQPPETPADRELTPRELTETEQRMADAFRRFSCTATDHEELPIVLYRWARLYYEANRLDEAAVIFRRVALEHARSEVAEYAANLYLDSVNMLVERRGREGCYATLRRDLDRLEPLYCEGALAERHADLCPTILAGRCHAMGVEAERLAEAGEHAASARRYLAAVREHHCPPERFLYNAAMQFEAARLLGPSIRVRSVLVQSSPEHPLARRSVYLIGANYHALAIYELAAEWYERYAREGDCAPFEGEACPDASEGLANAIFFRMGLGQDEEAGDGVRLFERSFGRRDPVRTAEVVFSYGAIHERNEDWPRMVAHYRQFLRAHARAATPTQLAQANVRIARARIRMDQRSQATTHLRATLAIHEQGAEAALSEAALGEAERRRSVASLRDAVAEARYELAEARRLEFEALRFPVFHGAANIPRVNRWAREELRPWLEAKRALLVAAEEAYNEVAPLEMPSWRIAAASRIGDMYLTIVEQVRSSPIPEEIRRFPDILDLVLDEYDRMVAPIERVAMERYESCLATATGVRWFDERSRQCERALHQLDPNRFPMAAELRGAPGYSPDPVAPPGGVVLESEDNG